MWTNLFILENWTKFGPEIVTKLPIKVFTVDETIFLKCAATGKYVRKSLLGNKSIMTNQ